MISRLNLNNISAILKIVKKHNIKCTFRPATALLYGSNLKNPLSPSINEYRNLIDMLILEKKGENRYILNSLDGLKYLRKWPGPRKISCMSGKTFFHIEPNGRIYPCIWGRSLESLPSRDCLEIGVKKAIEELPDAKCNGCWNGSLLELNLRSPAFLKN